MLLSHCQNIGIFLEAFLDLIVMVLNLIERFKKHLVLPGCVRICLDLHFIGIFYHFWGGCAWVC